MAQNRPTAFSSLRMGEVVRERVQVPNGETQDLAYTECRIVGNGSFGVVFHTKLSPSGEDAAIKRVLQDKRFKNRELELMRLLNHPNIIALRAFYHSNGERKDEVYLNLILEYMPETVYRASRYFNKMKTVMPIIEVKLYMYQVFRSLVYLDSLHICHRDIKPQNLLLDPTTGLVKLCDFGSAKILVEHEPNVSYICSRYYRSPELIFGATNYTTKIDVWSTGCVMAELLLGQPLFPGESGLDQLVEIIKVLGTPSRDDIRCMNPNYMEHKFPQIKPHSFDKVFRKADSNMIDLISSLLVYVPARRLSAIEALAHPAFDELRDPRALLPDSRHTQGGPRPLPPLFDFSYHELSIRPELNQALVPPHAREVLRAKGIDIDGSVMRNLADSDAHSSPTNNAVGVQDTPRPANTTVAESSRAAKEKITDVSAAQQRNETPQLQQGSRSSLVGDWIKTTIEAGFPWKDSVTSIHCKAYWQILQFCQQELSGHYGLHKVLTLTGSPTQAQALSCEDYVGMRWHAPGLKLLDAIVDGLSRGSCSIELSSGFTVDIEFNSHSPSFETANIRVSGFLDDIVATIEQLAWIASVCRLSGGNSLMTSSALFRRVDDIAGVRGADGKYELSLTNLSQECSSEPQHPGMISTKCWHTLFHGGLLASGFPIADRREGDGLEIPFPLMVALAGTSVSMDYDQGVLLLGPSSLLFPSKKLESAVQWHYFPGSKTQELLECISSCYTWVRERDISHLTSLRTFLGYCDHAQILLGTEELLATHVVGDSYLAKTDSRLELAREGTTSSGLSLKSMVHGTIALKWTLPKTLAVSFDGNRGYYDRLDKAVDRPILAYDLSTNTAWLVPELDMVLHMALTFLRQSKIQQRLHLSHGQTPAVNLQLPYATKSSANSSAVYETIQRHHELFLYKREDGSEKQMWHLVDEYLQDLAAIRNATNLRKASSGWSLSDPPLQGWDFNDLATKEHFIYQREVPKSAKRSTWWQLGKAENLLTVFGTNFGELIKPDLQQTKVMYGWESIPSRAELLVATLPCVEQLAKYALPKVKYENCYYLTPNLVWVKRSGRSSTCNGYCNHSCILIQKLQPAKKSAESPSKSDMKQVVAFGDPKYYHELLAPCSPSTWSWPAEIQDITTRS